ncbi:hypothetical protein M409DRAFT_62983 [Zasmidium cellare ATCC 36951]|uniref:AB hydrolase-1 domain-containing protein n=1 Tax=Zasmidium cellare ATCC 36951 TaxID=1080233 RepID=A0A6A6CZN7_ZASCE|nr:uncharacterized protein M409DRAFT_62983 [Zasmidium cellare ATCC 36951]KAF2172223.1 hypothetical protein M409DRAFT_62983 [Zasmidium cellare ATCC 36951]
MYAWTLACVTLLWRYGATASPPGYPDSAGFLNPGLVPLEISAINTDVLLPNLSNQWQISQTIQDIALSTPDQMRALLGDPLHINDTFKIECVLCAAPGHTSNESTVHIMSPGMGFQKHYWDTGNYSYVNNFLKTGYVTFAYSRLGVGNSDHPNPLQTVQAPVEIEILHALIDALRNGQLSSKRFSSIVGIGHGYGAAIQLGVNRKYPNDLNASIITGLADRLHHSGLALLGTAPAVASENAPANFSNDPMGYLVQNDAVSLAQSLLRWPFESGILGDVLNNRGEFTIGQILTYAGSIAPAPRYDRPVDVVLGSHDYIACGNSCDQLFDRAALSLAKLFPAAANGSQSLVVPNAGHLINLQYTSSIMYEQIAQFLRSHGL